MVALIWLALTYVVGLALPFHCTTEQGTKELPGTVSVTTSVNVGNGKPALTLVGDSELMAGEGRLVTGVVIVKGKLFDGPDAFDTETPTVPGNAASWAKIEAVSWPELMNVVTRGEPFQFTTDELSKLEPATVSVNPVGLQYGVEGSEVVDAESEVITGRAPGVAIIVKFTTFETSVVVVAVVPEAPETAEPGI
jgi:hypothetical protein